MSEDLVMSVAPTRPADRPGAALELRGDEVVAAFGADSASPLGRGAFGETWRLDFAGRPSLAAKVLLEHDISSARFAREVEGLRRVSNPHVVELVDTVSVTLSGRPRAALVFEFIDGGDLTARLGQGILVPPEQVLVFAQGLMTGLAALHAADTVHRDIKPANIALRDGSWSAPVILDLGLARMLDRDSITAYPALMGTALYMAPEQLRFERARKAADVFAAGVVLHTMLAGEHPFFAGRDTLALTEAVALIEAGAPRLAGVAPRCLATLVARLLTFDEAGRGSASRAKRDLDACVGQAQGGPDAMEGLRE